MKTFSRFLAVTLIAILLGSGASFAQYSDHVVKRIDHPNGPPTFAYTPAGRDGFREDVTISFYGRGRSAVGSDVIILPRHEREVRIPLHRGRGEVTYVPVETRW